MEAFAHAPVTYPIIADPTRVLAVRFGMLDPSEKDVAGLPLPCRSVFIIGPDKKLRLSILYPATTGRHFGEILRVVDSLQLTAEFPVATPVNWTSGCDCIVAPSLSDEEAGRRFPQGLQSTELPSGKNYMRITPQPNLSPASDLTN